VVAKHLSQVEERLAQVPPSCGIGQVGPEQAGQGIAPMRSVGFDRKVDQQCADFVIGKRAERDAGERGLEWP
jgi:hypothetical protein